MKMVNVNPKIETLTLWRDKFSEVVGNELIRGYASYIAGLPANRRKTKKNQTPKANQALVVTLASLNLTVALTNVKVISIMLNQARNPSQLSALVVVIMPAPPTRGASASKKTTHNSPMASELQLLLKPTQKMDIDLPRRRTSISITKHPATK
jgi:hypothetical protein